MGRKLMRVPLNFDWELNKRWEGYLNPHNKPCPDCKDGSSEAYDLVKKHIQKLMWDTDALKNKDYAQITTFLAGRSGDSLIGHDSSDLWSAIKKLGELSGLPKDWDICTSCNGSAIDKSVKEKYDNWEETEPPTGDGYQLWETTSEGSPCSPVFKTMDELCEWCEYNATTFADHKTTKELWKEMLEKGFVIQVEGNIVWI